MLEAKEAYEAGKFLLEAVGFPHRPWEELSPQEQDYWQELADEKNEADYAKS